MKLPLYFILRKNLKPHEVEANRVLSCVGQATHGEQFSEGAHARLQSSGRCSADCVLSPRTMGLALRHEFFVVSIPLTLNGFTELYF